MANAFIIEINGKAAGLVVEEKGGFRFYASHRIFWKLDGQVYRRVREAEKAARSLWGLHMDGGASGKADTTPVGRPDLVYRPWLDLRTIGRRGGEVTSPPPIV